MVRLTRLTRLIQALPAGLPGKARIARLLLGKLRNRSDVDIGTTSGLTIRAPSLREPIAFHLLCNGMYEPDTIRAILNQLPAEGTFVDVGANIGAIALEIAARRPKARIVAVEPSPAIISCLEHNIARNLLTNVSVVPVAASDHDGRIDFYLPPAEQFGMASAAPQFGVAPVHVRARKLDDILASLAIGKVDVIKIDAEGAELDVIRGARNLLTRPDAPAIIFEFVDWAEERLHPRGAAQRELMALGFSIRRLDRPKQTLDHPIENGGAMLIARKSRQVVEPTRNPSV